MSAVDLSALDLSRLERVRHHASGRLLARCPACAVSGGDRRSSHLVIFPDGRYACAAHPGDGDHRREIFALAGNPLEQRDGPRRSPLRSSRQRQEWRLKMEEERERHEAVSELQERTREARRNILLGYSGDGAEAWQDSPQIPDSHCVRRDPRHFLASLFPPQSLLWTGAVQATGSARHADRWRTCAEWQDVPRGPEIGPMVTPAIWQPGTVSRAAGQVRSAPYVVLDFDGVEGIYPQGPEQLREHLHASLALTRWLREELRWELAALLLTGGKGLHAWFYTPPPQVLASLSPLSAVLGLDAGLIGRPEHPCRLPGQRHHSTGRLSEVLWLQAGPAPIFHSIHNP